MKKYGTLNSLRVYFTRDKLNVDVRANFQAFLKITCNEKKNSFPRGTTTIEHK